MALKHVILKPIDPNYFTDNAGNLTRLGLFESPTTTWVINPTVTSPSDTYTEEDLDTNFLTVYSDDFTLTSADFTTTNWNISGWNTGDFASNLRSWILANAPADWETAILVYSELDGHQVAFMYKGGVSITSSVGTAAAITGETTTLDYNYKECVCVDTVNDKIVFVHRDGKATVGTVTGDTLSWGTPVQFEASTYYSKCVYDANSGKVVIFYLDNNYDFKGIVGTVSGTSISFGTATTIATSTDNQYFNAPVYDPYSQRTIVFYVDSDFQLSMGICSISGTTLTVDNTILDSNVTVYTPAVSRDSLRNSLNVLYRERDNNNGEVIGVRILGADSFEYTAQTTSVISNIHTQFSMDYNPKIDKHIITEWDNNGSYAITSPNYSTDSFSVSTELSTQFATDLGRHLVYNNKARVALSLTSSGVTPQLIWIYSTLGTYHLVSGDTETLNATTIGLIQNYKDNKLIFIGRNTTTLEGQIITLS